VRVPPHGHEAAGSAQGAAQGRQSLLQIVHQRGVAAHVARQLTQLPAQGAFTPVQEAVEHFAHQIVSRMSQDGQHGDERDDVGRKAALPRGQGIDSRQAENGEAGDRKVLQRRAPLDQRLMPGDRIPQQRYSQE